MKILKSQLSSKIFLLKIIFLQLRMNVILFALKNTKVVQWTEAIRVNF